ILRKDDRGMVEYLMQNRFIPNEICCAACRCPMNLCPYTRNIDSFAWRCISKSCKNYKKYISIRKDTFFEGFNIDIRTILRILIRYLMKQPLYSIMQCFKGGSTIRRVIEKFNDFIPEANFSENKLGGPGIIVQIDETMMNFKCKSHRGRSADNNTDALCIVEFREEITRAYAQIIPNKRADTIIPIICSQVANQSIIWTDEHRSYGNLSSFGFNHSTVCHKYEFINHSNGTNTQAVESFHNQLKLWIKKQKGVKTCCRARFLKVFLFFFNNRNNLLESGLNLIKK
ncbi:hypothetical protein DMUE_6126, partial [Dictyocoela muelleri]